MIRGSLPPVSSRSTLFLTFEMRDATTGDPIDFTGTELSIEITPRGEHCCRASKYDLSSGVAYVPTGYVQLLVPVEQHGLRPGSYTVRLFAKAYDFTSELLNVTLPVEV